MATPATRSDSLRLEVASVDLELLRPSMRAPGLPGVVALAAAARNGEGVGLVTSSGPTGEILTWTAPSGSAGPEVAVASDGSYMLEDGGDPDKWLRVQVYNAQLEVDPRSVQVDLVDVYDNGLAADDVTAAEASAGSTETYQITVANDSANPAKLVTFWLDAAVVDLEISDDGAAWVSPTTEATGLVLGTIAAAGTDILHLRRVIGAAEGSDPKVLNHLHYSFDSW